MNVSKQADAEFMRLLEKEDPKRYENLAKNIRQDQPASRMSEDQALTNFMLGLPTGQHRFQMIAGRPAPQPVADVAAVQNLRHTRHRIKQARAGRVSAGIAKNSLAAD
jgi:hypothetical protein